MVEEGGHFLGVLTKIVHFGILMIQEFQTGYASSINSVNLLVFLIQ